MKRINLTIPQRNDKTYRFELKDGDSLLDLTGKTVEVNLKASETADDATAYKPTVTIETPATGGKVNFTIPAAQSATAAGKWWRLDVVEPLNGNSRSTVFCGDFTIIPV